MNCHAAKILSVPLSMVNMLLLDLTAKVSNVSRANTIRIIVYTCCLFSLNLMKITNHIRF